MPADASIVGLVLWRNAVTDKPEDIRERWTDMGSARMRMSMDRWVYINGEEMWKQPTTYCDPPVPPVAGPHETLKVDDLRYALAHGVRAAEDEATFFHVCDPNGDGEEEYASLAARLRAALPKEVT